MRATALMLWRTLRRQVQLTSAALLCATVVAGCAGGVAHDHESAPGALPPVSASVSASATSQQAPLAHPVTTPVPPPVAGNIHQTVRPVAVTTMPPVPLHAVAHFGTGVSARIASAEAVHADAVGPGEISGPGLRIVIEVSNGTAQAISLNNAVVTITDAEGTPGLLMVFSPQVPDDVNHEPAVDPNSFSYPMTGSLQPHAKASGTYVFTIPAGHRNPVTVNFSYAGSAPVVLFKGDTA